MSHEIENNEMAYAGETPWHGLGTSLPAGSTPAQFLEAAHLDWTLDKHTLTAHATMPEGENPEEWQPGPAVDVPSAVAWIRSDTQKVMEISSPGWRPFQNKDALGFFDRYVTAGGATMETAGALRGGRVVWGLARLNHSFETRPGDKTNGFLLLVTPHQVGQAITIRTTSVRVVCRNTMALAESQGTEFYRQNHMGEFDEDAAREQVALAHEALAKAEAQSKILDALKLNIQDALTKVILPVIEPEFFEALEDKAVVDTEKMPTIAMGILHSIVHAPGAIPDTGWGVLNGVTHYLDHVHGRSAENRAFRNILGDFGRMKKRVNKALLDLATV